MFKKNPNTVMQLVTKDELWRPYVWTWLLTEIGLPPQLLALKTTPAPGVPLQLTLRFEGASLLCRGNSFQADLITSTGVCLVCFRAGPVAGQLFKESYLLTAETDSKPSMQT